MLGLRSLRNRLAVVFGLIVFGAVGTIYLTVTPRLEERLQDQKLDRLLADARSNVDGRTGFARQFVPKTDDVLPDTRVAAAAVGSSAEVLILEVLAEPAGGGAQDRLGARRRRHGHGCDRAGERGGRRPAARSRRR